MTHNLLVTKPVVSGPAPLRRKRRYSLFERKDGSKRWIRISDFAYDRETAVHVFQDRLIYGSLLEGRHLELRPID